MRVLITGSSGQIGTNLALRLIGDGDQIFGVDKRQNTWTDAFHYLLHDLSGNLAGVDYPPRCRRPSRRSREGASARARAAPRARERGDHVQRARALPEAAPPGRARLQPRGLRRCAPLRRLRRSDRGLRLHGVDILGVEDRRRGVRLLGFREHRAAHPEDRPVVSADSEIGWKTYASGAS